MRAFHSKGHVVTYTRRGRAGVVPDATPLEDAGRSEVREQIKSRRLVTLLT
jgi:hypothetical protein